MSKTNADVIAEAERMIDDCPDPDRQRVMRGLLRTIKDINKLEKEAKRLHAAGVPFSDDLLRFFELEARQ